jgi:hypothetical protein
VQAVEFGLGHVKVFGQALLARGLRAARTQRAHIKGLGLERLQERHVVELGVVRERHDGGVRVGQHLAHHVVGHAQEALHQIGRASCRERVYVLV